MIDPTPPIVQTGPQLQWQLGHAVAPDGTKLCVLILNLGPLTTQIALNTYDTDKLGRGLIDTAAQARTGLILPTGALPLPPPPNGSGHQ